MKRIETTEIASATMATPIGRLLVAATPQGLRRVCFAESANSTGAPPSSALANKGTSGSGQQARRYLAVALRQLRDYFGGRRSAFDLPLDLAGTAHQQRVWQALRQIPFGRTLSYGELAARLGTPRSARAVGRACATNPVPVVVPCHRVVGGDGDLHGYGGGLWRKQHLLELERGNSLRKAASHRHG